MGGALFSSGPDPLYTPRMPPAVYRRARDRCQAVLSRFYVVVATPVEGPGKTDFGDVDLLAAVGQPLDEGEGEEKTDKERLMMAAEQMGAVRTVDLSVADSLSAFHWDLFLHAHGDFWNMATLFLRPLGLVVDAEAFWLRAVEIEPHDRRRSRVFLTDEPAEVLHFLGFSSSDSASDSTWDHPFPDVPSLFRYLTTSRFFFVRDDLGVATLKANDRRRRLQRRVYKEWTLTYLPALVASSPAPKVLSADQIAVERKHVRDLALAAFPHAGPALQRNVRQFQRERRLVDLRRAAKEAVPGAPTLSQQQRGVVCAAVRRKLGLEGGDDDDDADTKKTTVDWTAEEVTAWVEANWKTFL